MVLDNLDLCLQKNRVRDLGNGGFVALDTLEKDYDQANVFARNLGENVTLHTYISISTMSNTSGPHTDAESVYCLQAQGITQFYVWEDGQQYDYIMFPGSFLHIPSGIPHEAIPLTPRVLLSYGDESELIANKPMELHDGI